MNWVQVKARSVVSAALLALPVVVLPVVGQALTQVAGPVQIGPSSGDGNDADHSAALSTTITNQGGLPDRLVNVACPGIGTIGLANGHVQPVAPGSDVQRNGLDLPPSLDGHVAPVQAQFSLSHATQPMVAGTLVSCALYFQHAGQRIVIFSLGAHEAATNEP